MIRNYFLAAIRNMKRYKVFTMINIAGLAIGLSICMVIIMTVANQIKSDRYNSKSDRLYRVISQRIENSGPFGGYATVALPLAGAISEHSSVKEAIRIRRGFGRHWIGKGEDQHIPVSGLYADPEFFSYFEYPLVMGDPETALKEPFSVVLTKETAIKIYGDAEAVGKILDMDELGEYTVTGIVDMESISTHLEFEAIASLSSTITLERENIMGDDLENWNNTTVGWVYFEIQAGADLQELERHIAELKSEHTTEELNIKYQLQSITSIKPGPLLGNEIGPFMPWIVVYILGGLGLLIMGSSCFNYINLSVARSMSRSREVGIRKVNGAEKKHIVYQFLVESILISILSLGLAMILLLYLEPSFEELNFASILKWDLSHDPVVWISVVLFTILTGAIAGIFPSLIMARFEPLKVIKGVKNLKLFSHVGLRKVLIVVQFSLSLFFIISILILYNQVNMMIKAETGFDSGNIVLLPYEEETFPVLRNALLQQSTIENISLTSHAPATGFTYADGLGRTQEDAKEGVNYYSVDENYLINMDVEPIVGRALKALQEGENESEVVINEQAVEYFGFSSANEALGEILFTYDSNKLTIVGVIPDYHHETLMMSMTPLALRTKPDMFTTVQVRVSDGKLAEALPVIQETWKQFNPEKLAEIITMKARILEFYDLIFGDLISILIVFAVIATIISCLGLLGIAIYTTELKLKEVSIRKIMGAGDGQLVFTLSWGFLKLVLIATVIAIPLAYFVNGLWLNSMATKIPMSPWFFLAGAFGLILISLITIGSQTLKSLRVNPADTLRNE